MRRFNVISIFLINIILIFAALTPVKASNLDFYRNILLSGKYTIKYENITPQPRVTNRDKIELFGKNGLAVNKNDYLTNKQIIGIITSNGPDRYEEVGDGNFNMCRLTKSEENFLFTKYKKGSGYEYFGTKKGKVEANARNYLSEAVEGQSYGDPEVTSLLNAMLQNSAKSASIPHYDFVNSGRLPNGLQYEDYKSNAQGVVNVIRYYFDGRSLVKIASALYYRKSNGKAEGRKCIIKISAFSAQPEVNLLSLPEGLKDVTKRHSEEK